MQQFAGQEPENDEKIAEFCELNHGVTFPLMAKSDVNGDNTNEVYKWLKSQKAGILGLTRIKVRVRDRATHSSSIPHFLRPLHDRLCPCTAQASLLSTLRTMLTLIYSGTLRSS